LAWSLQATRAVHSRHYHPREQQYIPTTRFLVLLIRKCCRSNITLAHHRYHLYLHPSVLRSYRCPPRPFPASPPLSSTSDAHETSVQFGGGGVNVGAPSVPATSQPHLSQGAANPATMHSFTSSPDIWQSSHHNTGVNVCPSPVTTTTVAGGLVTSSLGENLKGRMMQRRSPIESTRGTARYDPLSKQARVTSRPAVVTSAAAAAATTVAATGSEHLTDEGEERDSDGSVRDVRDKKRRYAKTFRDIEKQLFEKLRLRLFPQDPHAKRSECLEQGMCSLYTHLLPKL